VVHVAVVHADAPEAAEQLVEMARPTDRNSFKREAERTFPYRFDIRVPDSGGAVHRAPLKTGNLLGSRGLIDQQEGL
jgi:hypothetical protein